MYFGSGTKKDRNSYNEISRCFHHAIISTALNQPLLIRVFYYLYTIFYFIVFDIQRKVPETLLSSIQKSKPQHLITRTRFYYIKVKCLAIVIYIYCKQQCWNLSNDLNYVKVVVCIMQLILKQQRAYLFSIKDQMKRAFLPLLLKKWQDQLRFFGSS